MNYPRHAGSMARVVEVMRDADAPPDDPAAEILQRDLAIEWLRRINLERREAGWRARDNTWAPSPPMALHEALQRSAEWKAAYMAATRCVGHGDDHVLIRVEYGDGTGSPARARTFVERNWAFGYDGWTSEGLALGDKPACMRRGIDEPGGYYPDGPIILTHHSDAMDPAWTDFGYAERDGFTCTEYGRRFDR